MIEIEEFNKLFKYRSDDERNFEMFVAMGRLAFTKARLITLLTSKAAAAAKYDGPGCEWLDDREMDQQLPQIYQPYLNEALDALYVEGAIEPKNTRNNDDHHHIGDYRMRFIDEKRVDDILAEIVFPDP